MPEKIKLGKGIESWQNNVNNSYYVIQLHHFADPDKADPKWLEARRKESPSEALYQMEYLMDFSAYESARYFAKFGLTTHIKSLTYNPEMTLYRGWDFGRLAPAVIFVQIDEDDTVLCLNEYVGGNLMINDLAREVTEFTEENFPQARLMDYGDYAGHQRKDTATKSAIGILYDLGIQINAIPCKSDADALMLIDQRLRTPEGEIKLFVDEKCFYLIDAFSSEFRWDTKGRHPVEPNHPFNDIVDALKYIFLNKYTVRDFTRKRIIPKEWFRRNIISNITGY